MCNSRYRESKQWGIVITCVLSTQSFELMSEKERFDAKAREQQMIRDVSPVVECLWCSFV